LALQALERPKNSIDDVCVALCCVGKYALLPVHLQSCRRTPHEVFSHTMYNDIEDLLSLIVATLGSAVLERELITIKCSVVDIRNQIRDRCNKS